MPRRMSGFGAPCLGGFHCQACEGCCKACTSRITDTNTGVLETAAHSLSECHPARHRVPGQLRWRGIIVKAPRRVSGLCMRGQPLGPACTVSSQCMCKCGNSEGAARGRRVCARCSRGHRAARGSSSASGRLRRRPARAPPAGARLGTVPGPDPDPNPGGAPRAGGRHAGRAAAGRGRAAAGRAGVRAGRGRGRLHAWRVAGGRHGAPHAILVVRFFARTCAAAACGRCRLRGRRVPAAHVALYGSSF